MKNFLESILAKIPEIESVHVTDRDGIEFSSASRTDFNKKDIQLYSVLFNLTAEQCEKISDFGTSEFSISNFANFTLAQFKFDPLVLTIKAQKHVSADFLVDLGASVKQSLQPLREKVKLQEIS